MSAETLRAAAQRLRIRALTVNSEAHPNSTEVQKWCDEWEDLAAWLRDEADYTECLQQHGARGLAPDHPSIVLARAILGADA